MPVDMPDAIAHRILKYFAAHARDLPWRIPPGAKLPLGDPHWPYRVWLSEIMLQQTTVAAVRPYFAQFTRRWPTVEALARADDAEVMSAWAGLGYYARARNLLACARCIVAEHGGRFPDDEAVLRTLPGIGRYTAAAIAAIAFGKRAVVVDANVERVVARFFAEPHKAKLHALAASLTPAARAGDFAQAMMDLGATVCTARAPGCARCPLGDCCAGKNTPLAYPAKPIKPDRPERTGYAWWIASGDDAFLVTRPPSGLLGGMRALASTDWGAASPMVPPFAGSWRSYGTVAHVFTHFSLKLTVMGIVLEKDCKPPLVGEWWPKSTIDQAGLPTVFQKAARLALAMEAACER